MVERQHFSVWFFIAAHVVECYLTPMLRRAVIIVSALAVLSCTSTKRPGSIDAGYERVMRTGVIRCAYATWPPYMTKDPNTGALGGLCFEQMKKIAEYLELTLDWTEEVGYGNYMEGLKTGRYDMMCATVWPDGSRAKYTTLTVPGFYSAVYAFARQNEVEKFTSIASLNQASVTFGAIDGDITYSVAKTRFPKAEIYALPQASDGASLLTTVATGKADVAVSDEGMFIEFNKHNPGKLAKLDKVGAIGIFSESYSVRLGDFQLKNMIDTALTFLNNSGVTAALLKRAQGSSFPPSPTYTARVNAAATR